MESTKTAFASCWYKLFIPADYFEDTCNKTFRMSTVTKYLVYGPNQTLRRLAPSLLETVEPKYLYSYTSRDGLDEIHVALYEQYEKQVNTTVTLLCVIECNEKRNRIELKKAGGRLGFRGSSLTEEKNIEADVIDFILDFSKRFGLSIQEEVAESNKDEA